MSGLVELTFRLPTMSCHLLVPHRRVCIDGLSLLLLKEEKSTSFLVFASVTPPKKTLLIKSSYSVSPSIF